MYELKGEIQETRREIHIDPLGIFLHQGGPITSYYVCEHLATQPDLQRWSIPTFMTKEGRKGGTLKEEALGDYL